MKIEEIHIGQKVREKNNKFEMVVVSVGVLSIYMGGAYVYCDFEGNEGDVLEYKPEELEEVE